MQKQRISSLTRNQENGPWSQWQYIRGKGGKVPSRNEIQVVLDRKIRQDPKLGPQWWKRRWERPLIESFRRSIKLWWDNQPWRRRNRTQILRILALEKNWWLLWPPNRRCQQLLYSVKKSWLYRCVPDGNRMVYVGIPKINQCCCCAYFGGHRYSYRIPEIPARYLVLILSLKFECTYPIVIPVLLSNHIEACLTNPPPAGLNADISAELYALVW